MEQFEQILAQYTPMIYASIRKLSIYKNKDYFFHIGTIGLWNATVHYNETYGHFAPFAQKCIDTALIDELRREAKNEQRAIATDKDDFIAMLGATEEQLLSEDWLAIQKAMHCLNDKEKQFIHDYFKIGYTFEELCVKYATTKGTLSKLKAKIVHKLRKQLNV